MGPR